MNPKWNHYLGVGLNVAAGIDAYLASSQGAGVATAMHLSAGALGLAGTIILLLSKSVRDPSPSQGGAS